MEALVSFVTTHLNGVLSKEAIVFIISLLPILELRGGLLAASVLMKNSAGLFSRSDSLYHRKSPAHSSGASLY